MSRVTISNMSCSARTTLSFLDLSPSLCNSTNSTNFFKRSGSRAIRKFARNVFFEMLFSISLMMTPMILSHISPTTRVFKTSLKDS
nr:hypothetical protein Iba_chr02dCG4200 [Ipomoea batatas]